MKAKFKSVNFLIFLLGFLSLGAFYGSIVFLLKPDGSLFDMNVAMLAGSPFKDFLIPGLILGSIFGVLPLWEIYWLIKKPDIKWLNWLNIFKDHHFAWSFSVYIGLALIIWIDVQTFILNEVEFIHTFFSFLGILILCISLLSSVRLVYKK